MLCSVLRPSGHGDDLDVALPQEAAPASASVVRSPGGPPADGHDPRRDARPRTATRACWSRALKTELGRPSNCAAPSTTMTSLGPVVLPGGPPDAGGRAEQHEQDARTRAVTSRRAQRKAKNT
jgi:hypothetical protein